MNNGKKLELSIKKILSENPENFKERLEKTVQNIIATDNVLNADDIRYKILSVNNYSIFEWAIEENNISLLEELFSLLSEKQLIETLNFDGNTLFQKFLSLQYAKILFQDFNQEECMMGMELFLKKYNNHPGLIIKDFDGTIDNYIKGYNELEEVFKSTIQTLQLNNIISPETFNIYTEVIGNSEDI